MKLYNSLGPNPRLVRMFLLEKGLTIPFQEIDILAGENRREPYVAKQPSGQMPALETDDGRVFGETIAICEYLEEKHPKPALIGSSPEERAETRMWQRRIELGITEHLFNGFRFAEGLALFKPRIVTVPEAAAGLKAIKQDRLAWLDRQLEGKTWIAGERFTVADIQLYVALDFGATVGQPLDPKLGNVTAWFGRVAKRPSAEASLHPAAKVAGMKG